MHHSPMFTGKPICIVRTVRKKKCRRSTCANREFWLKIEIAVRFDTLALRAQLPKDPLTTETRLRLGVCVWRCPDAKIAAVTRNPDLAHRPLDLLRPQSKKKRVRRGSHGQQHSRIWLQDPGTRSQRRRGRRWSPAPEGSAKVGIVAWWRHDRNPCDSLRRVDIGAGQGFPADGEPLGDLGRLGRGVARSGAARYPGIGLRS